MLCSHESSCKSTDTPALIDSDVDSVGTGSVGDDEADDHEHVSTETTHPSLSETNLHGYFQNNNDENTSFMCFCDIFYAFHNFHDDYFDSSSDQPYEDICGGGSFKPAYKNEKKPVILNRQSAMKMRHKLDYMSLETSTRNLRLCQDKLSSSDRSHNVLFYDSDPNMLVTSPSGFHETDLRDDSDTLPSAESHDAQGYAYPTNYIPCSNSHVEITSASSIGLINELLHGSLRLRWHPFSSSGPYLGQPLYVKVRAWIEMGHRLKRMIIDPTFSWRPVASSEERVGHCNSHKPFSVGLMSISKILVPDPTEREMFPFANLSKSFIIWTAGSLRKEPVLFEASSSAERDRIIYGLKLIVSQLISRIFVGDSSVLTDYFSVANKNRRLSLTTSEKGSII